MQRPETASRPLINCSASRLAAPCWLAAALLMLASLSHADNRAWIEGFIATIDGEMAQAALYAENDQAAAAQAQLRLTAEKLYAEIGQLGWLAIEAKAQFPDWDIPQFNPTPMGLQPGLYDIRLDSFDQEYETRFLPQIELFKAKLRQKQVEQAVAIVSTAVVTFVEAYNTATGTDKLTKTAIILFGGDLKSMADDAKERAANISAGFAKVQNVREALKELEQVDATMVELRRRLVRGKQIATELEADIKGVTSLLAYYRATLQAARNATLPQADANPAFGATPYINAVQAVIDDIGAQRTPWANASQRANQIHSTATADYQASVKTAADVAEWARYMTTRNTWLALLDDRAAALTDLQQRVTAIQAEITGMEADYAALTMPPSTLLDSLQFINEAPSSVPFNLAVAIDTPWMAGVHWKHDGISFSEPEVRGTALHYSPYTNWQRPHFTAGEQAALDYLDRLWSGPQGALRWANATRAAVANKTHSAWFAAPYRDNAQPYAVAVLNGTQMRQVRDNLFAFQDEADAFAAAWDDIDTEAARIAGHRTTVRQLMDELAQFMDERPTLLPAGEMAYGIRFTDAQGNVPWVAREVLLARVAQLGVEAGLVASTAATAAERLYDNCEQAIRIVADDIAFNSQLGNSGGRAAIAAELLAGMRGDYQGSGYPGYLFESLTVIDQHLRSHFNPETYKISLNGVPVEDHAPHLRTYLDYVDSVAPAFKREFADAVAQVRTVTDQLLNARWEMREGGMMVVQSYAYHQDGAAGRLVFPENQAAVDTVVSGRWGLSLGFFLESQYAAGTHNRSFGETKGLLTLGEIRLGLPRLHSWLDTLEAVTGSGGSGGGSGSDPQADYTVSRGTVHHLSTQGYGNNRLDVTVRDAAGNLAAGVAVVCRVPLGGAEPWPLLAYSDSKGVATFIPLVELPAGSLPLEFTLNRRPVLNWTVTVDHDSDGDGIPDQMELALGKDPHFAWDGSMDSDGDGLDDATEIRLGTDPYTFDTDGDGVGDGDEVAAGSDPLKPNPPVYAGDPLVQPPRRVIGVDWVELPPAPLSDGLLPAHTGDPGEQLLGVLAGNGRLWQFTRTQYPNPGEFRCWTSTDGSTWSMSVSHLPTGFDAGSFVMVGARIAAIDGGGRVTFSEDGVTWSPASGPAPWFVLGGSTLRTRHQYVGHNNRLYVVGGRLLNPASDPGDVWSSADGVEWTQHATGLAFLQRRERFFAGSIGGTLVVAFGYDRDLGTTNWQGTYSQVMLSDDGAEWAPDATVLPMPGSPSGGNPAPWIDGWFAAVGDAVYCVAEYYTGALLGYSGGVFVWRNGAWQMLGSGSQIAAGTRPVNAFGGLFKISHRLTRYSGNFLGREPQPAEPFPIFGDARHMAAGESHYLLIDRSGALWAWGENNNGELGQGDAEPRALPVRVGTANDWVAVAAGQGMGVALNATGDLYAWGYNGSGQLGLGDTERRYVPTRVGAAGNWKAVTAGEYHVLAVDQSGTLWAWGSNSNGQLGRVYGYHQSALNSSPLPLQPDNTAGVVFGDVMARGNYSLALDPTATPGASYHFGQNPFDGSGSYYPLRMVQTSFATIRWAGVGLFLDSAARAYRGRTTTFEPLRRWGALAGSPDVGVGIQFNNSLWAWNESRTTAFQVGDAYDWIGVVGGPQHRGFLLQKADGSLWTFRNQGDRPRMVTPFGANYATDSDGDGLPDWYEQQYAPALDWTLGDDATLDSDNDGLDNLAEYALGTDPFNSDTDHDGLADGWEHRFGGDPLSAFLYSGSRLQWQADFRMESWQNAPYALHKNGNHLYCFVDGLRILDFSNPQQPQPIGYWDGYVETETMSGTLFMSGFASHGNRLIVSGGYGGWVHLDISNPAQPVVLRIANDHSVGEVFVTGDTVVMSESNYHRTAVFLYRIDGTGDLVRGATIPMSFDQSGNLAVANGRMACARSGGGILVYAVDDPDSPVVTAEWPATVEVVSLAWNGDVLYVIARNAVDQTVRLTLELTGGALQEAAPPVVLSNQRTDYMLVPPDGPWLAALQPGDWNGSAASIAGARWSDPLKPLWFEPWSMEDLQMWAPSAALFGDHLVLGGAERGLMILSLQTDDYDADGMPDNWERAMWGSLDQHGDDDPDGDGLSNRLEWYVGTDPRNPDSDGDGVPDGVEVARGTNPLVDESAPAVRLHIQRAAGGGWQVLVEAPSTSQVDIEHSTDGTVWHPQGSVPANSTIDLPPAAEGLWRARLAE
jgi:hypothetical protein